MNIHLITGPPGNAAEDYALEAMGSDDAIIDLAGLTFSVRSPELAEKLMAKAISLAVTNNVTTWVVSHDPEAERKIPYSTVTYRDPGQQLLLDAAETQDEIDLIQAWYERRATFELPPPARGISW